MKVQAVKNSLILFFVIFSFDIILGQQTQQELLQSTGTSPGQVPIIPQLAPNQGIQQQTSNTQYQGLPIEQQYANQRQTAMFSDKQFQNGNGQQNTQVLSSNAQYVESWQPTDGQQQQTMVYADNNNDYYYDNTQPGYYSNDQQGYYGNDQQYYGNQMYDSSSFGIDPRMTYGGHAPMDRYGIQGYGSHVVPYYNHYATNSYHGAATSHYGHYQRPNSAISDVFTLLLLTKVIRG